MKHDGEHRLNMDPYETSIHLHGQTTCSFLKTADEIGIASV